MTLQEALKIGSSADGYIKCTYAILYSIGELAKVWSLQNHAEINKARDEFNKSVGYSAPDDRADDKFSIIVDYPVLVVSDNPVYSEDGRMVKATLMDWAKEFIFTKSSIPLNVILSEVPIPGTDRRGWLYNAKKRYNEAKERFDRARRDVENMAIAVDVITAVVKAKLEAEYAAAEKELDAAREDLARCYASIERHKTYLAKLKKELDNPFWVKIVAIDWIPTDVNNAVIFDPEQQKVIADLNAAIEVSKQKLNKAKALLAAAGAIAII